MNWGAVSAFANVGTALAALGAAGIAWGSLSTWKSEMVGRRRLEIAEDTLALFYEAKEILLWVRVPASYDGEGASRPRGENETENVRSLLDAYYAPIARISRRSEFFASLDAKRYRAKALFGDKAEHVFQEMKASVSNIQGAALLLIHSFREGTPQQTQEEFERHKRWRDTIWGGDDDEWGQRINNAIKTAEDLFRPIITKAAAR